MVYRGHVENGIVVFDDLADLPDGLEVKVEPIGNPEEERALDEDGLTLGQKLLKHAGKAVGLRADLASNHDHCFYRSLEN
jgi:hypothetical protein